MTCCKKASYIWLCVNRCQVWFCQSTSSTMYSWVFAGNTITCHSSVPLCSLYTSRFPCPASTLDCFRDFQLPSTGTAYNDKVQYSKYKGTLTRNVCICVLFGLCYPVYENAKCSVWTPRQTRKSFCWRSTACYVHVYRMEGGVGFPSEQVWTVPCGWGGGLWVTNGIMGSGHSCEQTDKHDRKHYLPANYVWGDNNIQVSKSRKKTFLIPNWFIVLRTCIHWVRSRKSSPDSRSHFSPVTPGLHRHIPFWSHWRSSEPEHHIQLLIIESFWPSFSLVLAFTPLVNIWCQSLKSRILFFLNLILKVKF